MEGIDSEHLDCEKFTRLERPKIKIGLAFQGNEVHIEFNKAYALYGQFKHVKAIAEFTNAIEPGFKYHNTFFTL